MLYIKPPRGDIQLSQLYDCVMTRVDYFLHRYQQDRQVMKEVKFEYLTLGSALDRVGHFMLRLLSAESDLLKEFVISSEAKFVMERLEFLPTKQLLQLFKTTLRHVNETYDECKWNAEIKYIFTEIKKAFRCSHVVDLNHDNKCTEYKLKVPFQMCLSLVANRELPLERGKVIVPCGKWKLFLKCFFEAHTRKEINKLSSRRCLTTLQSDQRLQELKKVVVSSVVNSAVTGSSSSKASVSSAELQELYHSFPPCMGYLYQNLKTNHRLSHNARFNFSLFLKDIGMSVNESIVFWRSEYSKPSRCGDKCSHSWQKDSAKYTYSIRHLYGLEGRRATYCAPSCSKIQGNSLGPTDEGGCPFINFDLNRLCTVLDQRVVENKDDYEQIMFLRSHNKIQEACDYYRRALTKAASSTSANDIGEHKTPVEYFVLLNKQMNSDDSK